MAQEGQHDKAFVYSPPVHSTIRGEKRPPKTMPYLSKTFPQNITPVYPGEPRGLAATDDLQQNPYCQRSTSLVSTQPAAMVVGSSPNHLPCHVRVSSEGSRPQGNVEFPTKFNPRNTQSTESEETQRKGISVLPTNSRSTDTRQHLSPNQRFCAAVSPPPQHYTTGVSPPQHYTDTVRDPQHYTTAVSPPLLPHQAAAVPPQGSTTASDIPASRRGRLLRRESIQVGDHNDVYDIAQMTDFKDAKIKQVIINNHYYQCNNSKSNNLHKYVKTESERRVEVTNRHCSANGLAGSAAATDGTRSEKRNLDGMDQDSCGPVKRQKADLTETSYTKSDCWQELPDRIGVPTSSTKEWDHNSVNNDSVHSQFQRSCDSFVRLSSYEKHEMTSDDGRITLQKSSQSIICITDSVKIFDSDGEMVRKGDVLYIDNEGGYYGVYIGDGGVTFVEVDGMVTTKTVNENLTIPIATEQMDISAGYHGLQPLSRLETYRRAKDLIGQYFPGSGEDLAWFCRHGVPGVPK